MQSDELLLRAALSEDARAATAAWEAWEAGTAEPHPAALRLFPLVYRNLLTLGVAESAIPARCREAYRGSWIRTRFLTREAAGVVTALRAAGIESIVLKGAALVATCYRDPAARPMIDFDLLVHPGDAAAAAAALERMGWHARLPFEASGMGVRHGCEFKKGEWGCDLHWSVFWETMEEQADDTFWQGAQRATLEEVGISVLRPEHQLIHLAVHGTRRTEGANVRWIADAVTVLRNASAFDWQLFTREVHARGFEFPVGEAMAYLKRSFAAPVPAEVIEELLARLPSPLERRVYTIALSDVDDANPLGFVAPLWYKFLRQSRGGALRRALWFPRNLQYAWSVPKLRGLPGEIFRRTARKIVQMRRARPTA